MDLSSCRRSLERRKGTARLLMQTADEFAGGFRMPENQPSNKGE
jgi:hypothetical protein